jgi:hypothetical protein
VDFQKERFQFRALLLSNPNYFGTLKDSVFQPVQTIIQNTTYEKLTCVGFHPQLSRLEAVVQINQTSGYSGGICSAGSTEYVRFYLSFDNGATWLDQGMESFTAYDLPDPHPIDYAVSLSIDPQRLLCGSENLPLVRAVLSWNNPPTSPTIPPVWGNILDAQIQVDPLWILKFPHLFDQLDLKLPKKFLDLIDNTAPLKLKAPKVLTAGELTKLYEKAEVPAQRFLHPEIEKQINFPEAAAFAAPAGGKNFLAELGFDLSDLIGGFLSTSGNRDYEELECVGLDPNASTPDALVGVLRIKRPSGYLGDLCHAGSLEYVAFWVDWGDGVWQWVGTTSVRVHDISNISREGLLYSVYLPVNLNAHRKACAEGPVIARVRAILQWNSAPPSWNPDHIPPYGNRVESWIHVYPGAGAATGDYTPYLQNLCGIALCNIDQATGYAPGERPFGGEVQIFGFIPGAPNVLTLEANRPRYRIFVQSLAAGGPQNINDSFPLTLDEQIGGGLPVSTNTTQSVDEFDFYTYQEAPPTAGIGWRTTSPSRLLARWNTSGKTGLWRISIVAKDPVTATEFVAGTTLCAIDGTSRQSVVIRLDQAAPLTSLHITGYQHGGVGPVLTDILDCGTFQVGDVIHGSYSVSDEHFSSMSLTAQPVAGGAAGNFTVDGIATNSRSYPAVPTTGQSGVWTFNTAGLPACGYTIQLSTSDRTIANCNGGWENNSQFVGFCLVMP